VSAAAAQNGNIGLVFLGLRDGLARQKLIVDSATQSTVLPDEPTGAWFLLNREIPRDRWHVETFAVA